MYLKRLEIHGFKSFAHKTQLDFDPGITAVVGPNGSGKSNVADSLRWVMGEQSLKLLRGKKSGDVIFAGSDKKSKLSMAEVSLTFDNRDHKMPLDYSEVVIARRLFRNGDSEYLINNQKVRLFDIVDALIRSGFGATNYAVVGQGTIDQMVLAGPAEIKNLVEEAAGVKPYYIKREKTLRRLEQTEENLSRVSELLNEIEPRLKSLKRQARRMEERESIAQELGGLQLQYFGNQVFLIENDLNGIKTQLGLKNKDVEQLETEIRQFQRDLEKHEQQSRVAASFSEELEKKLNFLEDRKFKLAEELAEVRGKLKSTLVPGKIDAQSLNVEKLDYERQIEITEGKLKTVSQSFDQEKRDLGALKEKIGKLSQQIEQAKQQRLDKTAWQKYLEQFELDFNQILEQLHTENLSETKSKLRSLIAKLRSEYQNPSSPVDLSGLLVARDEINQQVHRLELLIVEHSTLKQNYEDNIQTWNNKLNQIKSLLRDNPEQLKSELFKQEESLSKNFREITKQMEELRQSQEKVRKEETVKKNFLMSEEKKFRQKNTELSGIKDSRNQVLVEIAKLETRLENVLREAKESLGGRAEQLNNHKSAMAAADTVNRIDRLKHQLELAGGVDESTMVEYRETKERFEYLSSQSQDLSKAVNDLRQVVEELDQIIKKQFDEAFEKISGKFVEYFRILFNGGRAQMSLVKAVQEEQPDEEGEETEEESEEEDGKEKRVDGIRLKKAGPEIVGIEIHATPPGKKLNSITALSGGERALTSIALLCAMLASYPSPFVVLDEVDAALDEANSIRFSKILGTLAHQTQFINITHNRETMRQAHTLYGVTMNEEGISKILSLKLEQAEELPNNQ
jgi:chromosome segregation protein